MTTIERVNAPNQAPIQEDEILLLPSLRHDGEPRSQVVPQNLMLRFRVGLEAPIFLHRSPDTGAAIQMFGDSARRVARGPGSVNFDFSLFKEVAFVERYRVQFRAEAFNLTNTPTFGLPSSNSPSMTCIGRTPGSACNDNNPEFGKLTGSSATGRQLQFGLKIVF